MSIEPEMTLAPSETPSEVPSPEFIQAISEFLDTDPSDLLAEMGYTHPNEARETAIAG